MFFWNRKQSLYESGLFQGLQDYHSHILPGVDDGIQRMEESLELLAHYETWGIQEVWLTPHIMEDVPNTTEKLRLRFEELKAVYRGSVQLHLAAEYMLDALFEERLRSGDLLPIGKEGNHLLVETSYYNAPADLYALLERIKSKGYYPLLAHPERYRYMSEKEYRRLREMDVRFQLNLPALAGMYSPGAQQRAKRLLEQGYYTVAGSDVHRFQAFRSMAAQKEIDKKRLKCFQPQQL